VDFSSTFVEKDTTSNLIAAGEIFSPAARIAGEWI
jgi:hypothetical protein